MSDKHCSACERLRADNLQVLEYGIGDKECESLQKDTGFNPDLKVLHNDCEDLHDLNDCFIGQKVKELPKYDDCDWKAYMRDFGRNAYNVYKGIICSICGIWKKIHELDREMFRLIACKEEGSGIFNGTVFSGSYMIDNKNSNRTLTTYQLRIQLVPTQDLNIAKGAMYPIPFKGKNYSDEKLPCIDIIMEHVEKVQWHNADIKTENDPPEVFPALESYIVSPGKNVAGRKFHGNLFIYAKDNPVTFKAGIPVQAAITWAMEPIKS